ncbi:hypothetical protein BDW22DRAFT_859654 [Trametopsis cervina]|nr:hypothetical protein BDW22DRAFT_859654 [Trametopsis cervina]
MPSFAELKERANKAKNTSLTKLSDTRDKYSSRSSKDLDRDAMEARRAAYTSPTAQAPKSPPPPPPPPPIHARTASVTRPSNLSAPPVSVSARPPVVRRDSRPDSTMSVKTTSPPPPPPPPARSISSIPRSPTQENEIDWAHLSAKDKEVFFSWLDEFFSRQLNITIPPRSAGPTVQPTGRPSAPPRPPPVNLSSRPSF